MKLVDRAALMAPVDFANNTEIRVRSCESDRPMSVLSFVARQRATFSPFHERHLSSLSDVESVWVSDDRRWCSRLHEEL
jgi:hypothetical protein